jgi:hypothetical protein
MKALTTQQRKHLISVVARSLAWNQLSTDTKNHCTWSAETVVSDLERLGVSGASIKRAIERLAQDEVAA